MSIRNVGNNQLKLSCDGPGLNGSCENYYIADCVDQASLDRASEWLERHGWRYTASGSHYCKYCASRMSLFRSREVGEGSTGSKEHRCLIGG